MTNISDFDYHLPPELIAKTPPAVRGASRMLTLDRATGECAIESFTNFPDHLRGGDCLVINNTKVIKARLYALKNGGGARVEILLVAPSETPGRWSCLMKPAKRAPPGTRLLLEMAAGQTGASEEWLTVTERLPEGFSEVEFDSSTPLKVVDRLGHVPLPPYIKREDTPSDIDRYQTVFAKTQGAVAAPTAGLHFDHATLSALAGKGVKMAELTLHVGPGTFQPVKVEHIEEHQMHSEWIDVPSSTADAVNGTRKSGGRVCAVGTTSLRAMESRLRTDGSLEAGDGWTDIFIHPPHRPRSADMLLTNFHLPKSTLLMLVCAFAGRERVMRAYELAIAERLRFYSYGDCMLII